MTDEQFKIMCDKLDAIISTLEGISWDCDRDRE